MILLLWQYEVTLMDENVLFRKFVAFIAAVHQRTNDMAKDLKLEAVTPVQYKMLEYIAVSQPVTISDISDCMHMSMPNTSRELKKLTDKGLCEKAADAGDRRKQFIRLSKTGEALMNEVFGQLKDRLFQRIGQRTDAEMREIERAIDLLHDKVFY
jgi:DNA-binding MarR family transcriptional regulator